MLACVQVEARVPLTQTRVGRLRNMSPSHQPQISPSRQTGRQGSKLPCAACVGLSDRCRNVATVIWHGPLWLVREGRMSIIEATGQYAIDYAAAVRERRQTEKAR